MSKNVKNQETRAQILAGAGRTFRSHGYQGAGVDGLAKAAGLTSGAFYTHFKSKAEAFRETVLTGMQDLEHAIRQTQSEGKGWLGTFVDFYLGEKRTCALTESCALQSLTAEVARADEDTRETFERQLRAVLQATADGLDDPSARARREQAIVTLVLLSGGVSLARAVNDAAFSEEIASAVRNMLLDSEALKAPACKSAKKAATSTRADPRASKTSTRADPRASKTSTRADPRASKTPTRADPRAGGTRKPAAR